MRGIFRGKFRMPLHANQPRVLRMLDGLHHAIRGMCHGAPSNRCCGRRLVVPRRHKRFQLFHNAGKLAVWCNRYAMAGSGIAPVVQHGFAHHIRQVRVHLPVGCHGEHLHAAADAQRWSASFAHDCARKRQLKRIALGIHPVDLWVVITGVFARVNVAAAGKDKAIQTCKHCGRISLAGRQQHWYAASAAHRVDVLG